MTDFSAKSGVDVEISLKDLHSYFNQFGKPKEKHRLGAECEIFGLRKSTAEPIPYFGRQGIEGVLDALERRFGWKRREEKGHIVALERGDDSITLEPGGQVELSASPVRTLSDIHKQIELFHKELRSVGQELDIEWLSMGAQPLARAGEMPWVPKARYEIMRRYLASHGTRSHDMMQRTATNQFNVDFESEAHGLEIMRLAFRITPFVVASFANSPLFEGRLSGFSSYRNHIWQGTDPDRSGLIQIFMEGSATFEDYLDYVLDISALFILRKGEWIPLDGITFRQFIEKGYGSHKATLEDFKLHLTVLFPECRLKDHIEIRCMDAQAPGFVMAVFAFWKGILENAETRRAALDLVKNLTWVELLAVYRDLPREGLSATVDVRSAGQISKQLFEIALFGLSGASDRKFLEPFFDRYAARGRAPADEIQELWNTQSQKSLNVFREWML